MQKKPATWRQHHEAPGSTSLTSGGFVVGHDVHSSSNERIAARGRASKSSKFGWSEPIVTARVR